MNDNNVNSIVENGEAKSPIYSSSFLMSKDLYYDFSSVSYNRTKKVYLTFLCLLAYLIGISLLLGNYGVVFGFGPFISFLMLIIYFGTKRSIKIGYERMLISEGKEITLKYELFEDKIVSHNDELKREYFYHQITKFFETKRFILLYLQHNLLVAINKDNLNSDADEVKSFIIEKCTLVKKKKFIDCSNDKKWALIFLIALITGSLVGMFVGLILKINSII